VGERDAAQVDLARERERIKDVAAHRDHLSEALVLADAATADAREILRAVEAGGTWAETKTRAEAWLRAHAEGQE